MFRSKATLKAPCRGICSLGAPQCVLGLLVGLSWLSPAASAQVYVFGTPNAALNSDGWALASPNMEGFRNAISNPANFGADAIVNVPISVLHLSEVTPGSLVGLDGFLSPWWSNTQSAPFQPAVLAAFAEGMDLWLLEDDAAHSPFGPALGITAASANGSPSNGSEPLFAGPFGNATNVKTFGAYAQFDAATVAAKGGIVAGTNSAGQITVVYWPKGTYAPGSGALVLFSDVDMISNWMEMPYTPALNDNGILGLNTMAWLATGALPIPEPGTYVLLGLGLPLILFLCRRRR